MTVRTNKQYSLIRRTVRRKTGYDAFLNHRGRDTKKSLASLLFHNLRNKGCKPFLDKKSIKAGRNIPNSIRRAILQSSVHVTILSPHYAESAWCLKEHCLILNTGAPIVPVFYGVHPSELEMEEGDGAYARAFQKHKRARKINRRTLKKWKEALRKLARIKGYVFKGDQGTLLERIARHVIKDIQKVKYAMESQTA